MSRDEEELMSQSSSTMEELTQEQIEEQSDEETFDSCESFTELDLDARLTRALSKMEIVKPTVIQAQSIPIALTGRDILAKAPTGSGKTLAYLLPILHKILNNERGVEGGEKGIEVQAVILVPTKELAVQVSKTVEEIARYCTKETLRIVNLAQEDSMSIQKSLLVSMMPNLIVSTPSRILPHLNNSTISLSAGVFHSLAIDEADLILSFGYQSDLDSLIAHLPKIFQTFLLSATLSEDLESLKALLLHSPAIIKYNGEDLTPNSSDPSQQERLKQYTIAAKGDEKFLFTFVALKLNLLKGKILIFCNGTERAFKLKLFLDQFGVKASVLNPELPLLSRHKIVEEFNLGVYDILIAADGAESAATAATQEPATKKSKKGKEAGVARGVDFKRVDVVLNFDFPLSVTSYTHRIGRTARGIDGKGTAVSLVDEEDDSETLKAVTEMHPLMTFPFPLDQLEAFRYRTMDALRASTKAAIKRARSQELSRHLLASQQLATTFFAARPKDLQALRNDKAMTHPLKLQAHLKYVPEYLLKSLGASTIRKRKQEEAKDQGEEEEGEDGQEENGQDVKKSAVVEIEEKIRIPNHLTLPQAPLNPTRGELNRAAGKPRRNPQNKKAKNDPLKSLKLKKRK